MKWSFFAAIGFIGCLLPVSAFSTETPTPKKRSIPRRLISNIGDLLTGGLLKDQSGPFVYGAPLGGEGSIAPDIKALAVAERSLLFTESFFVHDVDEPYCRVKGRKLHFITKPKMDMYRNDERVARIVKTEGNYEVLRGDTEEKIGQIQKTIKPDGKKFLFEFHATAEEGLDPKPAALYNLDGDFLNRRFMMKTRDNQLVAKVKKRITLFAAFDHYMVRVARGMDPILSIACMVVIDEELDEALKQKIVGRMERVKDKLTHRR